MFALKKFSVAVVVGVLSWPAYGVGLGDIQTWSHLGEPLDLEIELLSASTEQLEDNDVRLASRQHYQTVGLPFPDVGDELTFLIERQGGQASIRVSSTNPVSQTILPLIVEFNWGLGSLQRQYTVLLDPIGYEEQVPAEYQVVSTVTTGESEAIVSGYPDSGEVQTGQLELETAAASTPVSAGSSVSAPTSVTVKPGDSLSRIVARIQPDGATSFQAGLSIFEANPDAFIGNNINKLRSGVELTIPPAGEMLARSESEARKQFMAAVEAGQPVAVAAAEPVPSEAEPSVDPEPAAVAGTGTAEASSEDSAASTASGEGEFGLRLLPAESIETAPTTASVETQTASTVESANNAVASGSLPAGSAIASASQAPEVQALNTQLTAIEAENEMLRERLSKLEVQLAVIARLVPQEQLEAFGVIAGDTTVTTATGDATTSSGNAAADPVAATAAVEPAAEPGTELAETVESAEVGLDSATTGMAEADDMTDETGESEVAGLPLDLTAGSDAAATVADDAPGETAGETEALASVASTASTEPVAQDDPVDSSEPVVDEVALAGAAATAGANGSEEYPRFQSSSSLGSLAGAPATLVGAAGVLLFFGLFLLIARTMNRRSRSGGTIGINPRAGATLNQSAAAVGINSEFASLQAGSGVSYLKPEEEDDMFVSLDMDSLSLLSQQSDMPDDVAAAASGRVDSITEAEVYMTYNRPHQAIQVLDEEYRKRTQNQAQIAIKLLDVYSTLEEGDNDNSLQSLVERLYEDRYDFTNEEWEEITEKIWEVSGQDSKLASGPDVDISDNSLEPEGFADSLVYDDKGDLIYKQG